MRLGSASVSMRLVALALVLGAATPAPAGANELAAVASAPGGFVIHDAASTLSDYCRWEDGVLWLELPGGTRWELVTSTSDPAITNPGDGSFHPFDAAEVSAALAAVRYPLGDVSAEVFLLPYPRRDGLESAAGPGLILLSPGVLPLSADHQHAEFVHELGHVVQYALMPDRDLVAWTRYRTLRGITDTTVYSADASHADRPHEIFAEDFRALFGDADANYSGSIENPALAYPTTVQGLDGFVLALSTTPATGALAALAAGPSPSRGAVLFVRRSGGEAPLDLFDAGGRRLATLMPAPGDGGVAWSWDGRDAAGRPVRATVVFARVRDGRGGVARVTMLP